HLDREQLTIEWFPYATNWTILLIFVTQSSDVEERREMYISLQEMLKNLLFRLKLHDCICTRLFENRGDISRRTTHSSRLLNILLFKTAFGQRTINY
ncbi:hypothetical protein pdam_00023927, partial [Pocillopora damicornis]